MTAAKKRPAEHPVLEAIERHRAAAERFDRACNRTDEILARLEGRKVSAAEWAEHESSYQAEEYALDRLFGRPAPTKAALRAKLAYLATLSDPLSFPALASRALTLLEAA
jgi:hypothetical protein